MKKVVCLVLMLFVLVGCGSGSSPSVSQPNEQGKSDVKDLDITQKDLDKLKQDIEKIDVGEDLEAFSE